MIKLEVEDYCHDDCMDFEAEVKHPAMLFCGGEPYEAVSDTIIRCKNRFRCKRMMARCMARVEKKGETK